MHAKPSILVIGGADPSGGAGIQADLHTLWNLGLHASSIITALTAQNDAEFLSFCTTPVQNFIDQLESIPLPKEGSLFIKVGMLGSGALIAPLVQWISKLKFYHLVLDPVFVSSTGFHLLDQSGIERLQDTLFRFVHVLTPNLSEARDLTGIEIDSRSKMEKAAQALLKKLLLNAAEETPKKAVLLKGGHLETDPFDLLLWGDQLFWFEGKRIKTRGCHGTGCTMASAMTGFLAKGFTLNGAVLNAKRVVEEKIQENR